MGQAARAMVVSTVMTFILAGCVGGGEDAGTSEPAVIQASGEALPDAGSISGTVVDESLAPVLGAQVAILDLALQGAADESGFFQFTNLAPGSYKLAAVALGYSSAAKSVNVEANEDTPVQFVLTQISSAFVEPYVELLGPYSWYFDCRVGTPVLTGPCLPVGAANPNDKAAQNFTMTDDIVDFVGEMRWLQGSFATSRNLRMSFSYEGRPSSHWWCTSTSGSPLQWHYNLPDALEKAADGCKTPSYCGIGASQGLSADDGKHKVPTVDHVLVAYVNTPFGCPDDPTHAVEVSLQQRLEVVITLFHGEPKPPEYTGFPDV